MHIFRKTKKNRKNPSHDDRINQKACFLTFCKINTIFTVSFKPLSRREISALVPQYSDVTIKRALINLQKTRQIKLIGQGRTSKYILQNP
jgi:hypothetical protein